MTRLRWIGDRNFHARPRRVSVGGKAVALGPDNSVPVEVSDADVTRYVGTGDYEVDTRSLPQRAVERLLPGIEDAVSVVLDAARVDAGLRKRLANFLTPFRAAVIPPPPAVIPPPPAVAPPEKPKAAPAPKADPEPEPEPEPEARPDLVMAAGHEVAEAAEAAPAPKAAPAPEPEPEPEAAPEMTLALAFAKEQGPKSVILSDLKAADPPIEYDGRWSKVKLVAALFGLPDDWKDAA